MESVSVKPQDLVRALQKKLYREDIEQVGRLHAYKEKARSRGKSGILLCLLALVGAAALFVAFKMGKLPVVSGSSGQNTYPIISGFLAFSGVLFWWICSRQDNRAQVAFSSYKPKIKIKSIKAGTFIFEPFHGVNGCYLFNRSGHTNPVEIDFYSERNIEKLKNMLQRYRQMSQSMPAVMSSDSRKLVRVTDELEHPIFSEETELHSLLEEICEVLDNLESRKESYHLLSLSKEELFELLELAKLESPGFSPVRATLTEMTDIGSIIRQIEGEFSSQGSENEALSAERFLDQFGSEIGEVLGTLDSSRKASFVDMIKPFSDDLERLSTITSYNCYCPECNQEAIDATANSEWNSENGYPKLDMATRMKPVPGGIYWECPVCGNRTGTPFPVHKMLDNLLFPTMDRLLQENRVDRLKLYLDAEKRKMEILGDEQREIRETIDSSEQASSLIQNRIRDISSGVETAKSTIGLLMAELGSFESVNRSRLDTISSEINTVVNEISDYRNRTLTSFNQSIDEMLQQADIKMEDLAKMAREDEEARMAIMREMSQNMQAVATSNVQIAENTGQMTQQLGQISENTASIAKTSLESSSATRAMARKSGAYKPSFPNVTGMIGQKWGDVKQSVTGTSDYDRGRSEIKD